MLKVSVSPEEIQAFQQMLEQVSNKDWDDRLSPLPERAKVALFMCMRARMGHEAACLYRSSLTCASTVKQPPADRYVVKLGDFFVCEWGSGDWENYPKQALSRARKVFKRRASSVQVGERAVKLSQLAPEEVDSRVMRHMENQLRTYLGC